ncbi:unnamed protein product [Fraxinus pennsylvanica]|uniref:Glyoxalase At5g48480-like N-terminal domain-containing protein n=1 Tax=Fraxinus pennsylvanica TaxID=56036 RepID=A0AAD2DTJ6_9LAMI|nr:unnamed protein product [Fraxinus pennsylvanica]
MLEFQTKALGSFQHLSKETELSTSFNSTYKDMNFETIERASDVVQLYKTVFGAEELSRVMHIKRKADHEISGNFLTGDCGGLLGCKELGAPPTTFAKYELNSWANKDYYDIFPELKIKSAIVVVLDPIDDDSAKLD